MGIYSCFVPEGVTGYLYIEADNKQSVTEALAEFRNINLTTLKLVPMNEMSNVFTTGKGNEREEMFRKRKFILPERGRVRES